MNLFKFSLIVILILGTFACSKDAISNIQKSDSCKDEKAVYQDIRLKTSQNLEYSYEKIADKYLLTKSTFLKNGFYILSIYENNLIVKQEHYLPNNQLNSFEKLFYSQQGHVFKSENYTLRQDKFELTEIKTFRTDDKGNIIRENLYNVLDVDNIELLCYHTFEWRDCNLIKEMLYDHNDILGYTTINQYDSFPNPFNLPSTISQKAFKKSRNNVIRKLIVFADNPNYSGITFDFDHQDLESIYQYNELNLPINYRHPNSSEDFNFTYEMNL